MSSGTSGLVRSPANTAVSPSISFAACSATSPSRSLISTFAPSRQKSSAVARPIPRADPVMIALFPSSSPKGCLLVERVLRREARSNPISATAGFLPKSVGGDPVGDHGALGIGDAHLAEAETPASLRHAGLGPQVDAVGCRGEVDRERDRRSGEALGLLVGGPGGGHRGGV